MQLQMDVSNCHTINELRVLSNQRPLSSYNKDEMKLFDDKSRVIIKEALDKKTLAKERLSDDNIEEAIELLQKSYTLFESKETISILASCYIKIGDMRLARYMIDKINFMMSGDLGYQYYEEVRSVLSQIT